MDKIMAALVNWQALLVAFASFALLGVIRALGTKKDKAGKVIGGFALNRWFQMLLPIYPYALAMLAVFTPGLPMPEVLPKTIAVKIMFGLWTGWISGFSYQLAKKVLEKGFGVTFSGDAFVASPTSPPTDTTPPSA